MWHEAEVVERLTTDRGELVLQRRGHDFEIISNGTFLMATYNGDSERELAQAPLRAVEAPRSVLIGGLGVGLSLQEVLRDDRVERVDVFEIEPKIVEWNRTWFGTTAQSAIEDPRTRIRLCDLVDWLYHSPDTGVGRGTGVRHGTEVGRDTGNSPDTGVRRGTEVGYDVICLDIDNGSDWTVYEGNRNLYSDEGLNRITNLLHQDGAVSFWNARRDMVFEHRLEEHFAEIRTVLAEHPIGEPDVVYIATGPLH